MAPRARPLTPHSSLKTLMVWPNRVPPDQSSTESPADLRASSGSRLDSSRVTRVSRVPRVNTSTLVRPTTAAWAKRISALAYGSIEPLTSSSSTSLLARSLWRRNSRRIGSPPVASALRTVRRRSGWPTLAPGPHEPQRLPLLRHHLEGRHQPVQLVELGVAAGGEVLVAQRLGPAPAHLHDEALDGLGLVLGPVVVAGVVGIVGDDRDGHRQRRRGDRDPGGVLPEDPERAVVDGAILGPADERRPPRPVHATALVDARPRPAPRRRAAPSPTGTSSSAARQQAGEGDRDALGRAGERGVDVAGDVVGRRHGRVPPDRLSRRVRWPRR